MAKILVFDNDPFGDSNPNKVDSNNVPLQWKDYLLSTTAGLSGSEQNPVRTLPVRIHTASEEIRYVGWEFLLWGTGVPIGATLRVMWWQEFYGDRSVYENAQVVSPRARNWTDIDPDMPWMRETALVDSGGQEASYNTRLLDMYAITRRMTMQSRNAVPDPVTAKNSDSLYFPLAVHGKWARIAFWIDAANSNLAANQALEASAIRIAIFAHVGGHDEDRYIEQLGLVPYAYNAYGS